MNKDVNWKKINARSDSYGEKISKLGQKRILKIKTSGKDIRWKLDENDEMI